MEILWIFTILFSSLLGIFIFVTIRDAKYFTSRGIMYLGNMNYPMVFYNQSIADNSLYWYQKAKRRNLKVAGIKELFNRTIVVIDPDLIKQIMVKDFEHFVDHRIFKFSTRDYVLKRFLGMTTGEQWKSKRCKVTPAFSSGKIRRMFKIFETSCRKFVTYLEQETENCAQIDLYDCCLKFTTDVVASAAFGHESGAFNQRETSLFQIMGERLKFESKGLKIIKFLCMELFPRKISEFFRLSFLPVDVQNYFSQMVKTEIGRREESGEKREDFIQIMLEAKEREINNKKLPAIENEAWNDEDITAQSIQFILAGLDATNGSLVFLPYVLALNPDVQNRLFQEISNSLETTEGELTYESIHKMEYLDMVMNETLRLYSPGLFTDRACTKNFRIPDTNIMIKKEEIVFIPIRGIHLDPDHFEDPERFDPERWTAENRPKIHPYSFFPFGHGPRSCPAMRFAVTEVKLAIAYLVQNFFFEPCEKTSIPMKFGNSLTLRPRDGMWMTLIKRT